MPLSRTLFFSRKEIQNMMQISNGLITYYLMRDKLCRVQIGRYQRILNPQLDVLDLMFEELPPLLDKEDLKALFRIPALSDKTFKALGAFHIPSEGLQINKDALIDFVHEQICEIVD